MTKQSGVVKFYSQDKGYGFVFSCSNEDVWFHITSVNGPNPPQTGDTVNFSVSQGKKGPIAKEITITAAAADIKNEKLTTQKKSRELKGFPCIRGDTLRGFHVQRHCGGFFRNNIKTEEFSSANAAKDALLWKAKQNGANAVLNFYTHRRTFWHTGFLGGRSQITRFWAEGEPVFLEPDD